ncbi:MAG: peptidoglycan-binding protein [Scytonema sp. PMC 1069.18]|nr:peptidoglycan-binding protein [Scytonema sp. PMC 1069.18]MEC4886617.1 peptidoglycan-binding protein [Scytonema sp. PMC 1070.18]
MQTTVCTNQPVLKIGSTGSAVVELQKLLTQRVPVVDELEVDGIFGAVTELSVKVFQFCVFLEDDGIVGSLTWLALQLGQRPDLPVLHQGSQGIDVIRVQNILKFNTFTKEYMGFDGYDFGSIDGIFGAKTEEAVKAFQYDRGLLVDGVIASKTWKELMKLASIISHIAL